MDNRVIVTGLKPPLSLDVLELWLESYKHDGGPLMNIEQDPETEMVTAEFIHNEHAANILEMKSTVINGVTVSFSKPIPEDFADEEEDDPNSLVVTGLGPNIDKEILTLLFESERKSGGGELESIQMDKSKGQAIIRFVDEKVASRVLKRKYLTLADSRLGLQKLHKAKWDGRSIEVHGFQEELNVELLSLLFESRKRSRGGPIDEIIMAEYSVVIRFINKLDAQRVLEKGTVKLGDRELTMKRHDSEQDTTQTTKTTEQEEEPITDVIVLGVNQMTTTDMLELFFENEQKSGGGTVKEIKLDEEFRTAVVTFESHGVAARVAMKQRLSFMGGHLLVELKVPIHRSIQSQPHINKTETAQGGVYKLEVIGILKNTPQSYLQLFFESPVKCGGGPVKTVDFDDDNGTALIEFEDESALRNVMSRYNEQGLTHQGSRLCLSVVDASQHMFYNKGSCAIEVKGAPANCQEDMIELFFENRRQSGGGEIEEVTFLEESIVVSFKSYEVAERVYAKHRVSPLQMEDHIIDVKHMKNDHRPNVLHDKTILEQNALFLEDLPESAQRDDILQYLHKVPKCEVREIWFGVNKGNAIAQFQIMPEYQTIYEHCCLKPLRGKLIGVRCVEKAKSIEVYNINGLSKQKLEMYFEHRRSGGGEIQDICVNTEDGYAIITFTKYGVAENVVNKKDHVMDKIELEVGLHYECLGILPPAHDRSTPKESIPEDIEIQGADIDIIRYLSQTPANKSLMNNRLEAVDAELVWPNEEDGIVIRCILTTATATKAKTETWTDSAKKTFEEVQGLYMKDSMHVLREGWPEFIKQTGQLERFDDTLMVQVNNDTCTVTAVGKLTAVKQIVSDVTQKRFEVQQAIERNNQTISEEITNIPAIKIQCLIAIGFPERMRQAYPNAQVQLKRTKVTIKGLPNEVMAIKLRTYEQINDLKSDMMNVSASVSDLLKQEETRAFVASVLQKRNICMLFEVGKPGNVMVYAKTTEDITTGTSVLNGSIVENTKKIENEHAHIIETPGWHKFMDSLKSHYAGVLTIDITDSHIRLVCIRDISENVMETIAVYFDENMILEQFIKMDEGTLKYLTRFKDKELHTITKKFKMEIRPKVDDHTCGFLVKGTKHGLASSIPLIEELAGNIVECTHVIKAPGMPKYFLSERGQRYLESVEHKSKVVIHTCNTEDIQTVTDFSSAPTEVQTNVISKTELNSGHIISVVHEDLSLHKVDATVNTSNEHLEFIGGLSKALVDKGGKSIQEECRQFIAQRGAALKTGAIYVSEAGKLPCKKIIHTSSPRWEGGSRGEIQKLHVVVTRSLEAARKIGLRTIAIPAISSGIFGFPLTVSCKTILQAVSEFTEHDQSLTEIHLVDITAEVVRTFHEEMCAKFGRENIVVLKRRSKLMPANTAMGATAYTPTKRDQQFKDVHKILKLQIYGEDQKSIDEVAMTIDCICSGKTPAQDYLTKGEDEGQAANLSPPHRGLPNNWKPMAKGERFKVVPLAQMENEYQAIEARFVSSMFAGDSSFNTILSICRIQNPNLYQRYIVHKGHMDIDNPPDTQNERELWHGTSADSLNEIHATGFNRAFCGANGTAYGKGVYFAGPVGLSDRYARPDSSSTKHMYLCRVLTGEFTKGQSQFIVPPPKNRRDTTIKFDSVVDNERNPKMFVIFFDTQAYPEYLIQYN